MIYNQQFQTNILILIMSNKPTVLILLALLVSIATCKLIYGFGLVRHGVKYPFIGFTAPQITNKFKGELIRAGTRQLYNLGAALRENYVNQQKFLPQNFDQTIQCYSSSLQRTQISTYAFLYGLYPLEQGLNITQTIPQDFLDPPYRPLFSNHLITEPKHSTFALRQGFTPIPVHPLDYVLDSCFNISSLETKRKAQLTEDRARLDEEHSVLFHKMKLLFKLSSQLDNVDLIVVLNQDLEADPYIGITLPKDYTPQDNQQLKFIDDYYNARYYQDKFGMILSTFPYQFMRSKIVQAISGKNNKKMLIISCHSSTLWPFMNNLNLTSSTCIAQKRNKTLPQGRNCVVPDFASSLIVQVHEDQKTHDKFVKIKFNGDYMNVCESSLKTCPLSEFLLRVERKEQNDYELQCGSRPNKGFITFKK